MRESDSVDRSRTERRRCSTAVSMSDSTRSDAARGGRPRRSPSARRRVATFDLSCLTLHRLRSAAWSISSLALLDSVRTTEIWARSDVASHLDTSELVACHVDATASFRADLLSGQSALCAQAPNRIVLFRRRSRQIVGSPPKNWLRSSCPIVSVLSMPLLRSISRSRLTTRSIYLFAQRDAIAHSHLVVYNPPCFVARLDDAREAAALPWGNACSPILFAG